MKLEVHMYMLLSLLEVAATYIGYIKIIQNVTLEKALSLHCFQNLLKFFHTRTFYFGQQASRKKGIWLQNEKYLIFL